MFLTYQFLFFTLSGKCVFSTLCRACKKESVLYAPILNYENNGCNFNNNGIFNVLLSNTQSLSSNLFGIVFSFCIALLNSPGAWSIITISLSLTRQIVCFFFQSDLINFLKKIWTTTTAGNENDAWGSVNSQGSKKLRQFKAINSPLPLKKRLMKTIWDAKTGDNLYLFGGVRGGQRILNPWVSVIFTCSLNLGEISEMVHMTYTALCCLFCFPSKVIHNCQAWRNKSHSKQKLYVSVICSENCFCKR